MRLISHIDCMDMNPFISFCLYVAARVFLHILKKKSDDQEIRSSLEFLLGAMQQLRRRNPLSESFLIQLSLDLDGTGLDTLLHNPDRSSNLAKMSTMAKWNHSATGENGCGSFAGASLKQQDGSFFKRYPQSKESSPKDTFSVGDGIFGSPDYQPDAQYSMHKFEVTAREQRSLSTEYQSNLVPPVPEQLQKLASGQGWGDQISGRSTSMADMTSNNYETDMSDRSGSGGQNSQGLTPNTAYSPPSQNGDPSNANIDSNKNGFSDPTSTLSQNANSVAVGMQSPGKFFDFSAAAAGTAAPVPSVSQAQQLGDNSMGFSIGPEWGSATGGGINVSGMVAPGQDGMWTSILEGMNWEGGAGGVEWGGGDGDNQTGR
ncbi:MAG: hypothetical protein Q9167_006001 [Letrouitia subvulpina]